MTMATDEPTYAIDEDGDYLIITRLIDDRCWIVNKDDLDDGRLFSAFASRDDADAEIALWEGETRDAKYDEWG